MRRNNQASMTRVIEGIADQVEQMAYTCRCKVTFTEVNQVPRNKPSVLQLNASLQVIMLPWFCAQPIYENVVGLGDRRSAIIYNTQYLFYTIDKT